MRARTEGNGDQNFGASCVRQLGGDSHIASALKNAPIASPLREDMGA